MGPKGEAEARDIIEAILDFRGKMLSAGFEMPTEMRFEPRAATYLRSLAGRYGTGVDYDAMRSVTDPGYCATIAGVVCREDRSGRR